MAASRDAISLLRTGPDAQRRAFCEYAARIALQAGFEGASHVVREVIQKQAVDAAERGEIIDPAGILSRYWLPTIANRSLLDALARHALVLPPEVQRVGLVTGVVASGVTQGAAKPLSRFSVSAPSEEAEKVACIVTMTKELAKAGDGPFLAAIDRLLTDAVAGAGNISVLNALTTMAGSDVTAIASTGDALTDLRAGIEAADRLSPFVVAASPGAVASLALRAEAGSGFGIFGGTFREGIEIVPVADHVGLTIIPTARAAMWLTDLTISRSTEASIQMDDSPNGSSTAPTAANLVSMFQTNSVALLAERHYQLAGDCAVVTVGAES